MNVLAFDTCLDKMYVILAKDDVVLDSKIIETTKEHYHSAFLISTIKDLLQGQNISPQEIDVIVTNVGPGSFTGIRACTTVARVFAQASGAKVVGVSSLEILSRLSKWKMENGKSKMENACHCEKSCLQDDEAIQKYPSPQPSPARGEGVDLTKSSHVSRLTLVALDARKDMAYVAAYENIKEILAPQTMLLEDLKELIADGRHFIVTDDILAPTLGGISYQHTDKDLGKFLIEIAIEKLEQNCETDWCKLHPLYIQPVTVNGKR
jgi:tRNA threonylcarbamoyl adenosine modification protein YeaZ